MRVEEKNDATNHSLNRAVPGNDGVDASAQEKPKDGYFTTKDGVKIHYLIQGQGTPVILIHGYTGSAYGNWFRNGVAQALVKKPHGRGDRLPKSRSER